MRTVYYIVDVQIVKDFIIVSENKRQQFKQSGIIIVHSNLVSVYQGAAKQG